MWELRKKLGKFPSQLTPSSKSFPKIKIPSSNNPKKSPKELPLLIKSISPNFKSPDLKKKSASNPSNQLMIFSTIYLPAQKPNRSGAPLRRKQKCQRRQNKVKNNQNRNLIRRNFQSTRNMSKRKKRKRKLANLQRSFPSKPLTCSFQQLSKHKVKNWLRLKSKIHQGAGIRRRKKTNCRKIWREAYFQKEREVSIPSMLKTWWKGWSDCSDNPVSYSRRKNILWCQHMRRCMMIISWASSWRWLLCCWCLVF